MCKISGDSKKNSKGMVSPGLVLPLQLVLCLRLEALDQGSVAPLRGEPVMFCFILVNIMCKCSISNLKIKTENNLLALVATLLATADNSHLKIGPQRSIEGLVLLNVVRRLPHRLQHR